MSLLCLKELVTSTTAVHRLGVLCVCSLTDMAFTYSPLPLRLFCSSLLVPAGERLKAVVEGDLSVFWG